MIIPQKRHELLQYLWTKKQQSRFGFFSSAGNVCDISTPINLLNESGQVLKPFASSGLLIWITNKTTDGKNYLDEFIQDTQFRVQCFTNVLQSVYDKSHKGWTELWSIAFIINEDEIVNRREVLSNDCEVSLKRFKYTFIFYHISINFSFIIFR